MFLTLRTLWLLSILNQNSSEINFNIDLHKPIEVELIVAGNFGELRPNHFHTGIDFKTKGKEGLNLFSIADGYVSRIKTSSSGYGKVIYIDHPQFGITSVYAHCQNFKGTIADYTLSAQNAAEFYEIDIQVPHHAIPIKKGEVIALSGNTGTSTGPHLHFEIRETKSENPLNPLMFNSLMIADTRPPIIQKLVIYALSKYGYRIPDKKIELQVKPINGIFSITNDTIDIPSHFCSEHGGIGLGLDAQDKYNASEDLCGIYQGVLTMNDDTVHRQIMKRLDFEVNRQINTHKDYEAYRASKIKIEKYFRTIHNKIPIYDTEKGKGILGFQPDHFYNIKFSISDLAKNISLLSFVIRTLPGPLREENTPFDVYHSNYLYPDRSYVFRDNNYEIEVPENCLYEPIKKFISYNSGQLAFGSSSTPINHNIRYGITIEKDKIPREKLVMFNHENKSYHIGQVENDRFISEAKTLGTFSLTFDTIAPQITKKFKLKNTPQVVSRLAWTVKDDKSGLKYYALYINDKYHLLEYEHKRSELFANLQLESGKYNFRIVVKDAVGNLREEKFELTVK